jgi:MurNAc alpha-1-phosphate uridylyltransferase
LTDNLPKPLLKVHGKALLTHIIEHLLAEGVMRIVINGYHAIDPLRTYIAEIEKAYPQCEFILSEETELLDTGGGAVQALRYFDDSKPFYMINGDAYWVNAPQERSLQNLAASWNSAKNDILLLLQSCESMAMTTPVGDYVINDGYAYRSKDKKGTHMFTGVRICTPSIVREYHLEKFSFLKIMDDCEDANRLGGLNHNGEWYHISTPQDLADVNDAKETAA